MKPGTIVRLPDGREATVVYHGLEGYGIVWGRRSVDVEAIESCNPLVGDDKHPPAVPEPEALLREPWGGEQIECVGDDYVIVDTNEPQRAER